MIKRTKAVRICRYAVLYLVLVVFGLFFLFPFVFMFFKSVMSDLESVGMPYVRFFPTEWHFENYAKVFDADFIRYFRNTLIVVVCNMIGVPLAACLCAYGFARGHFRGKNVCFMFVLSTIMLPAAVTQVPVFILFRMFNMTGTLLPLIIPNLFGGGALNIFLARQFIRSLPKELDEAAVMDGAGRLRIFFSVIIPLVKPIIIYIMVNTFMSCWRDFDAALVYIGNTASSREWQTLALGIYYKFLIRGTTDVYPNLQMATGVIMVIPVAVLFLIFQRQLIDGVVLTGIKG